MKWTGAKSHSTESWYVYLKCQTDRLGSGRNDSPAEQLGYCLQVKPGPAPRNLPQRTLRRGQRAAKRRCDTMSGARGCGTMSGARACGSLKRSPWPYPNFTLWCTFRWYITTSSAYRDLLGYGFCNLFVWYRLSSKGKGKGFPVHAIKPCTGNGGIVPLVLNLDTTLRWVVNLKPRTLYPEGRMPQPAWAFCRRGKNLLLLPAFEPQTIKPVAQ